MSEDAFVDPFHAESSGSVPTGAPSGAPIGSAWSLGSGPLEPVILTHRIDHAFKKKPDGKRGCAECGEGKGKIVHHAYPASFNVGGSSRNPFAWQNEKQMFEAFFIDAIEEAGLPKGLGSVNVEGTLTFPTRRIPDQGNFRFPLEKHLGDALVRGQWIKDDDWSMYTFGNLSHRYEKGVRELELIFFPSWDSSPTFT